MQMTKLAPFRHNEIALRVNCGAVGELQMPTSTDPAAGRSWPVAWDQDCRDLRDDIAGLVQHRHTALQFGKDRIIPANINAAGCGDLFE